MRLAPLLLLLSAACVGPKGADDSTPVDLDRDGYTADEDCDDGDPAANPGATEVCDGGDEDCDGVTDEADAQGARPWYADADTDGFGDPDSATIACTQPSGFIADDTDCDDGRADVSPASTEFCDSVDNDCDAVADEPDAADAPLWYADSDADGFGDPAFPTTACAQPSGFVADDTDCDDARADVSPASTEFCDSVDNDCDTLVDEPDAADAATWFADTDADGYGDPTLFTFACTQPSGLISDGSDCADADAAIHPNATEFCDSIDNDCDTLTDEPDAADALTWFADSDGDGYGDLIATTPACAQPSGFVADTTDCDDTDGAVSPSAAEVCWNGLDDDCDPASSSCDPYTLSLSDADAQIDGTTQNDFLGLDFAVVDFDGDGHLDIAANGASSAYVVLGPFSGTTTTASATWSLSVSADYQPLDGILVEDLDGSGAPDVVVSAPLAAPTSSGAPIGAGAVLLFIDPAPGTVTDADADAIWLGGQRGDQIGQAIESVADVDGDGTRDLAISNLAGSRASPGYLDIVSATDRGSIAVSTVAQTRIRSDISYYYLGLDIQAGGDMNGDGVEDYALADPAYTATQTGYYGAAWIVPGPLPTGTVDISAIGTVIESGSYSAGVYQLDLPGDLDGDGLADLIVGYNSYRGLTTGAGLCIFTDTQSAGQDFGDAHARMTPVHGLPQLASVSIGGDVNGDGTPDLATSVVDWGYIGAYGFLFGSLDIFLDLPEGVVDYPTSDAQLIGNIDDSIDGLDIAQDLNSDGIDDLVVGVWGYDDGTSRYNVGSLMLFFGGME